MSELQSRRRFLEGCAGALASLGAVFTVVPMASALLSTRPSGTAADYVEIGSVADLKTGEPAQITFTDVEQDAYVRAEVPRSVWAVKRPAGAVVVYTPVCPHLGCQVAWDGVSKRFVCPCHASIWTVDGRLLSGPSPRGLDTLPSKVDGGMLFVKWERYKLAIPEKIPVT